MLGTNSDYWFEIPIRSLRTGKVMLNKPSIDVLSMMIYSVKSGYNPIFSRVVLYNTVGILLQRRFSIHNISCTYDMVISHTLAGE